MTTFAPWRAVLFTALILGGALLGGCQNMPTEPTQQIVRVPAGRPASHLISDDSDPCWTQPYGTCHDWGDFATTDDYSGFSNTSSYDNYTCSSCTTYGLGTLTRAKVLDQLNNHIKLDSDCQSVKNWLLGKVSDGFVRFYPNDDGNYGDIHYVGTYIYGIHVWAQLFVAGREKDLGITLMHEGYHGYYDYHNDETAPENFAVSCVY